MKWSFGIVSVILTIVFSYMAIQNNKMAREITAREFGLKQTTNQSKEVEFKDSFDQEWEKSQKEFNKEWDNWGK
ncbi:hypothetical protein [Sulfurimonas sp.]|uniref:hypothetical protein n=1 Tax=Sulfurimonas sp. TaxID=2022749 RepID=UPI0025E94569|nr:hypothetical protein [Sulfurimonas sp.]